MIKIGNFLLNYTSNILINTLIYLSSVFKILRKENKIFQDLRISADLADSALGYRGIFEGRKVGCITYLKTCIKIGVNTMDRDNNGRRAFDLSDKANFSAMRCLKSAKVNRCTCSFSLLTDCFCLNWSCLFAVFL